MKWKKIIAPVIITISLLVYLISFVVIGIYENDMPLIMKFFMIVIPLLLAGASIYVLIERIKEIRSGEEDDLSKYWLHIRKRIWNAWPS